jgi:hypothetical protein
LDESEAGRKLPEAGPSPGTGDHEQEKRQAADGEDDPGELHREIRECRIF